MFELITEDGNARYGILKTRHGKVETPFFMPVATRACGKYIGTDDYTSMNAKAVISNAFVLSMNPGVEIIEKAGGLNKFMNFPNATFTDCGGFQMSSQTMFLQTSKRGIHFKSPFDGKKILITPEKIMDTQMRLKSDVAMMLDDMAPYGSTYDEVKKSVQHTHEWAKECLKFHTDRKQLLFGISQGGFFSDLRKKSAEFINSLDFDGVAVGGLAIGEKKSEMHLAMDAALPYISKKKIRYAMGLGTPNDLLDAISRGFDCFDSIFPTRGARHHNMFTWQGRLVLDKSIYADSDKPIDEECDCFVCRNYTRAYMRYLAKMNEPIGKRFRQYHNLYFILRLMDRVRREIKEGTFSKFKDEMIKKYSKKPA